MFRVWLDMTSMKNILADHFGIQHLSTAVLGEVRDEFCEQVENELDALLPVSPQKILGIVLEENFYLRPRISANDGCVQNLDAKAPPVASESTT